MTDLRYLVLSALLTWVMLLTASLLHARGWTPRGVWLAVGNRDNLDEPTPMVARAIRAGRNMVESMVLFTAVLAAARLSGVDGSELSLGAAVFFWARVAYFPIYLAGIPGLRTLIWYVAIVGIALIGRTVL